jgi:hypothetical protein
VYVQYISINPPALSLHIYLLHCDQIWRNGSSVSKVLLWLSAVQSSLWTFPLDGWPPLPVYWPQLATVLAVHEITTIVFCITILLIISRLKSHLGGRIRVRIARFTVNCSPVRMITIAEPWQDLGLQRGFQKHCKLLFAVKWVEMCIPVEV